jgi:hypothetical protein
MVDIPDWAQEAAPAVPSWAQADPLDDVASDSMRREKAQMDNRATGAKLPAWMLAMAPDAIKGDVREGAGSLINDAAATPGAIWDGIKGAAGRVAHYVDKPEAIVSDAKALGQGVAHAITNPGETADNVLRSSAEHPFQALLNGLTLGSSGELTLGRGALKAGTKTAAGADAALVRPVNSLLSGVSGDAQKIAQDAGERGGVAGQAFRTNMAEPDFAGMQANGQAGVRGLKAERGSAYDQGMQDVANSPARIRYTNTTGAVDSARRDFGLGANGQFVKNPDVMATLDEVEKAIAEHRAIPGQPNLRASARSPFEMDELKQRLNKMWRDAPEGSPQQAAVGRVIKTIGDDIVSKVPTYADVMSEYGGASDGIRNAITQLGLGKRATRGTAAGKLMSAMRDTGSATQITKGDALADVARHAPTLPYQIAGASMNPVLPRGIVARGGALLHGLEGAGAGAALAHFLHPGTLLPLLASSPRVIGNARYALGAATRGTRNIGATQKNLGLAADAARLSSIWDDPSNQ